MQASTEKFRLIAAGRRGLKTPNQEILILNKNHKTLSLEVVWGFTDFWRTFFFTLATGGGVMDFVLIQPCRMTENGVILNWLQKKKIL